MKKKNFKKNTNFTFCKNTGQMERRKDVASMEK